VEATGSTAAATEDSIPLPDPKPKTVAPAPTKTAKAKVKSRQRGSLRREFDRLLFAPRGLFD
jgi:hypothetical protein